MPRVGYRGQAQPFERAQAHPRLDRDIEGLDELVEKHLDLHRDVPGRKAVLADPSKVVRTEIPEWRIIDEPVWEAVQKLIAMKADEAGERGPVTPWPHNKYMLSGIAKCKACQQAIGVQNTTRAGERVRAYGCAYHQKRGSRACPEVHVQPIDAGPFTYFPVDELPTKEQLLAQGFKEQVHLRLCECSQELARPRLKDGSEMPELVEQLNEVKERIRSADQQLRAAQSAAKAPETELAAFEAIIREDTARLREVLSEPGTPGLRDALASLFPDGLLMTPAEKEDRRVWAISGVPTLGGSRLQSDPTGTSRKVRNYFVQVSYMTPRTPSQRRDRGLTRS